MIARLRSRWLAAVLLLASPAMGGLVLPVVHPCEASQAVTPTPAAHHGQSSHHSQHGQDQSGEHRCTCVGSCHAPALDVAPRLEGPVAAIVPLADAAPTITPTTAAKFSLRPLDLLPPSNAPPLV